MDVRMACNEGTVRLYADGELLGSYSGDASGSYVIDDDTSVVGFECESPNGAILAEVGDNYFTDSTWLCTNWYYQYWSSPGYLFNDDVWWGAHVLGDNSQTESFGQRSEIESDVKWIWTDNSPSDTRVYCRGVVNGKHCNPKQIA